MKTEKNLIDASFLYFKTRKVFGNFLVYDKYVKEYIPLTENEKKIVNAFFGESYQMELCNMQTIEHNRGEL